MKPYKLLIRESHVDSLGHMNNATYLQIFEEARWDGISENGYGFAEIQKYQQGPVILDVNLKFLREVKLREFVTITTELLHYNSKVGQLKQQMIKENGEVAAEAVFSFGLFDMKARKLIAPTPQWLNALGLGVSDS